MTTTTVRLLRMALSALALVFVASTVGLGQAPQGQPAPRRVHVQVNHLKPDMAETYRTLIRDEVMPAEKKAGVPWRATFEPVSFGEAFTYVVVRPIHGYAQFDQPGPLLRVLGADGAARLNARVRATLTARRSMAQVLQPQYSIESGATSLPGMILIQERKLLPGRTQEYLNLLTTQLLPGYRKGGMKDYWVHTTTLGAPVHLTIVRPIGSFAELEAGLGGGALARAVGQEASQKIIEQIAALTDSLESTVMRLVPELSYSPSPATTSAAPGGDPQLGTWRLNVAKWKPADPNAQPQRVPATLVISPVEGGHHFVSNFVDAQGRSVRQEYTAKYDNQPHPRVSIVGGVPAMSTVAIRAIDAFTYEYTFTNPNGQKGVQRTVISKDGLTRTNTTEIAMPDGKKGINVVVYDKQ